MEVSSFNNAICKCLVQRLCIDTILMLKLKNPTYSSCGTPDDKASLWCVIRSRHNRVSIYRNLRTAGYVILQSPPECPQCPPHHSCVWSFGATQSYHAASSGQGARSRLGWGCCVAPSQLSFLLRQGLLLLMFFINANYKADIKIAIWLITLWEKSRWKVRTEMLAAAGWRVSKNENPAPARVRLGIYKVSSIGCWELSHY